MTSPSATDAATPATLFVLATASAFWRDSGITWSEVISPEVNPEIQKFLGAGKRGRIGGALGFAARRVQPGHVNGQRSHGDHGEHQDANQK